MSYTHTETAYVADKFLNEHEDISKFYIYNIVAAADIA